MSDDKTLNVRGEAFAVGQKYLLAIERAGGIPVVVPPIPALIDRVPSLIERADGLVLHGGGDIDPRQYGHDVTDESVYGVIPEHDEVELAVVGAAIAADLPVLAICRGMQILNVGCGGTLIQDIASESHWFTHQSVILEPDSLISAAVGANRIDDCHCVHHQALDQIGAGLRVVGSSGGWPHAVEMPDKSWIVGTQWHPEDTAGTDNAQQRLFDELIRRAR